MNIINVFKGKVESFLVGSGQDVSEKIIELATFFYKIDRRVSLEEQAYIDDLLKNIEWSSSVSVESFQRNCISKINKIVCSDNDQISIYLSNLMQEIESLGASESAKSIAKEISDADGEIADDEVKYLELVLAYS